MLTLNEIKKFFPKSLQRFPRFMLREYLQCKILEIIYESPFATDLYFLGGTCLRIVHENRRFSEDLDFNNISLDEANFKKVADEIEKQLVREGYGVELKTIMKGAWHCYIKFPGLLYDEGLSGYQEEKILIQIDTEPQDFHYEPERYILNRFEVFTTLLITPLPLLMSQKIYAIINRDRTKGRDFYDLAFLMSRGVKPDYEYAEEKFSISEAESLKQRLLERCHQLDMKSMAEDVEPFLFTSSDSRKVTMFKDLLQQYQF